MKLYLTPVVERGVGVTVLADVAKREADRITKGCEVVPSMSVRQAMASSTGDVAVGMVRIEVPLGLGQAICAGGADVAMGERLRNLHVVQDGVEGMLSLLGIGAGYPVAEVVNYLVLVLGHYRAVCKLEALLPAPRLGFVENGSRLAKLNGAHAAGMLVGIAWRVEAVNKALSWFWKGEGVGEVGFKALACPFDKVRSVDGQVVTLADKFGGYGVVPAKAVMVVIDVFAACAELGPRTWARGGVGYEILAQEFGRGTVLVAEGRKTGMGDSDITKILMTIPVGAERRVQTRLDSMCAEAREKKVVRRYPLGEVSYDVAWASTGEAARVRQGLPAAMKQRGGMDASSMAAFQSQMSVLAEHLTEQVVDNGRLRGTVDELRKSMVDMKVAQEKAAQTVNTLASALHESLLEAREDRRLMMAEMRTEIRAICGVSKRGAGKRKIQL